MKKKYCKVIEDYKSTCSDPLIITQGEILIVEKRESEWPDWIWCRNKGGKEGWVPENYLEIYENSGKALQNYNATELSVKIGEGLMIEKEESGWIWSTNQQGKSGWVPLRNIHII